MPPFFAFQLRVFALVLALLLPARVLFFALQLRAFAMVLVLWLPARVPLFAFQLRAFALALVLCLTFGPTEKVPDRYFRGLSWAPVSPKRPGRLPEGPGRVPNRIFDPLAIV
jgi:hypothetical protein